MVRGVSGSSRFAHGKFELRTRRILGSNDAISLLARLFVDFRERSTFDQGSLFLGTKVKIGVITTNYYAF